MQTEIHTLEFLLLYCLLLLQCFKKICLLQAGYSQFVHIGFNFLLSIIKMPKCNLQIILSNIVYVL